MIQSPTAPHSKLPLDQCTVAVLRPRAARTCSTPPTYIPLLWMNNPTPPPSIRNLFWSCDVADDTRPTADGTDAARGKIESLSFIGDILLSTPDPMHLIYARHIYLSSSNRPIMRVNVARQTTMRSELVFLPIYRPSGALDMRSLLVVLSPAFTSCIVSGLLWTSAIAKSPGPSEVRHVRYLTDPKRSITGRAVSSWKTTGRHREWWPRWWPICSYDPSSVSPAPYSAASFVPSIFNGDVEMKCSDVMSD